MENNTNKNNQWCSLHSHSFYSLLDGCSSIKQCIKRAKEVNISRFAVTDHGMMSGAMELLQESKKQGVLGLIGVEFYVSEKHSTVKDTENRHCSHLVMIAKDIVGYRQLCKMLSKANSNESFYYKPRLSLNEIDEFLAADRGHILGVCGHMGSALGEQIIVERSKGQWEYQQNWKERGKKCIQKLQQMFGEHNLGVEVQTYEGKRSGFQELIVGLRELCKEMGAMPITTADSHYAYREQAEIQRVLLCVQMKKKLDDMMNNPDELGILRVLPYR
jgi:DNA polymerase-3 subunit alpha